ncbi:Outer membrane protein assembly factor BamB, contains PQQ-like beta-propeller repeat [Sporobacter termitidis DSM 10068]|uniref:Outer membrane protein assembly factor BamB, contains PQQ-like beta-propeller repeat n=1 Tax=Sporobacter termitidis DSM 10068 TaxID=1123282 RepID=A0A1M5VJK7_9FIRM|nr:S-layer homology domain-containing protein [Sporobacter termitidis]SHH75397.1 Outer membrane protein assembly factor BamB, contains PQQ-like beta-propeller repeat [Sporobacter termitidis DSM 10068]
MIKKRLQKNIAVLLTLLMVVALLPAPALAADPPTVVDLNDAAGDVTISEGGSYIVSGSTTQYTLIIDTTGAADKAVDLTLDNASIRLPSDYAGTGPYALAIKGGAMVNLTAKDGTVNTLSAETLNSGGSSTGRGISLDASTLNIGGTGTLNATGTSYAAYSSAGSAITISDVTVNFSCSVSGPNFNCLSLNDTSLTVNSGAVTLTIPEKEGSTSSGTSGALSFSGSSSAYTQNGGSVIINNFTTLTSYAYGAIFYGTAVMNGGTMFAYGAGSGVRMYTGTAFAIKDAASLIAAAGNKGSAAYSVQSTGKFTQADGADKGFTSLKLAEGGPLTTGSILTLKKLSGGAPADELSVTLPADTYYMGFAGSVGSTYYLETSGSYITTLSNGLYNPGLIGSFAEKPATVDAYVKTLPASFTVTAPGNTHTLTLNTSMPLGIDPALVSEWTSNNTAVATVDSAGVVSAVAEGTATITVSCLGVTGTYDLTVVPMMNPRTATLTVDIADPGLNVVVSKGDFRYSPVSSSDGVYTYQLEDGEYAYAVSKDGFPTRTGTFAVSEGGANSASVSLYYRATFNIRAGEGVASTDGAVITVYDSDNAPVSGSGGTYSQLNGAYTFTVTLDGCYPASGAFSSEGTVPVVMNKDRGIDAPAADWSGAYNHTNGNAVVAKTLPTSADGTYQKWSAMVGTNNYGAAYAGQSVVVNGYLYITGNGYLNKIDVDTGNIVAQTQAGVTSYVYDYLAYGDGMIFLSTSGYIAAYEVGSLTFLWRTSVGGQHSTMVGGSQNSNGTINTFRPIVYSNGYVFCGKNAFRATSFAVDANGYNAPAWSINDDFNWNTGVVVGDTYYVAAAKKIYAVNYKTGEILNSYTFGSNTAYTWGGVAYSPDTGRLYWGTYGGKMLYSYKIDQATGKLITAYTPAADKPLSIDLSQSTVCTPVIYNGRVYVTGQSGNVDVLQTTASTLTKLYTINAPGATKIQSTPILSTAYATDENKTVYLYFQGYSEPSPIYVMKDSAAITAADPANVSVLASPTASQFAYEQIAADNDGRLYFFNESGYLFCFEKLSMATAASVTALLNALPASASVVKSDEARITNARKAYNALSPEVQSTIASATYKKLTNAEAALAAIANQPEPPKTDITVTFSLLGDTVHDSDTDGIVHTLKAGNLTPWINPPESFTLPAGSTVMDVFAAALMKYGYSWYNKGPNGTLLNDTTGYYITSITTPGGVTLAEFTNGANSGWMYTLNGTHSLNSLRDQRLSNGDVIVWHYTDDYTQEEGSEKWNDTGSGSTAGTAQTLTPVATVKDGVASVSMSLSDLKDAIVSAKTSGGAITIAPSASGTVTAAKLELSKEALNAVAVQTSADLTIKTSLGSITLSNAALSSIVSQASGSAVTVSLETVNTASLTDTQRAAVGNDTVYSISVLSGGTHISGFGGANLTISLPYTLKNGQSASNVAVWYLNDAGALQRLTCSYDAAARLATFVTTHLSYYAVGYDDWANPYTDVLTDDWFYDAVQYAGRNGLMGGTTATTFDPGANTTRAMLVTVLYRLAGKPAASGISSFTDVKSGEWYADAVVWASANGIVDGYGNGLFGTNDAITREQMAVILYRYAKYKGCDVTKTTALTAYADASAVDSWASTAMTWVVAEGLITGTTATTLSPTGIASRAQAATILMRYVKNVTK